MATTMRAAVFHGKGKIELREVPRPEPGVGQALIKVTLTTICGTDVHILKGEYPVREGLDRRPRAGRRDRGARARRDRVPDGRSRHRRSDHAVRPVPRLPLGRRRRSAATAATATRRSAAGASATRSTAARPSTCWSPTRRPTWPRSRTASPTRRCSCARTSCRPASRPPSAATSGSATRSPSSRRGRSACARRRARGSPARRS